jgi:hypothetical protein
MGSSELGRIERQIRTIEATNIRVMNLLLVLYPFIGRLQAGDVARETVEKIVRWNYGVPTENSIALKKRGQHSRGDEFLGLRKHLSNRRVVNDLPYRLPEQITAVGSVYILKRKRLLKLPVVRIGGEVLPPGAVQ